MRNSAVDLSLAGPNRRAIPVRYWMVFAMFTLSMLLYVDRVCISAAQTVIAGEFHLSDTQMGWVLSSFALGYALFQVPSGMLVDRFGARAVLSTVVTVWSVFTVVTAAAHNYASLLIYRFLFGVGEAGAYPSCARAIYSWIPMSERGFMQGVTFSGARVGAAISLPIVAWLISEIGWRFSFVVLGAIGIVWAVFWFRWFRDDPEEHQLLLPTERWLILQGRQQAVQSEDGEQRRIFMGELFRSRNTWLLLWQYFCSNFTFFFCLTWLFPYLKSRYSLTIVEAGFYAALPPLAGAFGNWIAGALIDLIYRRGKWDASRRVPAITGFILAAAGLIASLQADTALVAVICLSIAVLGADMSVAPSWTVCIDIARKHAGTVSGTMNMAGNLGSFITALAFPYLMTWTGTHTAFFYLGAALNVLAASAWLLIRPGCRLGQY